MGRSRTSGSGVAPSVQLFLGSCLFLGCLFRWRLLLRVCLDLLHDLVQILDGLDRLLEHGLFVGIQVDLDDALDTLGADVYAPLPAGLTRVALPVTVRPDQGRLLDGSEVSLRRRVGGLFVSGHRRDRFTNRTAVLRDARARARGGADERCGGGTTTPDNAQTDPSEGSGIGKVRAEADSTKLKNFINNLTE